jgi:hypothetical protein
MIRAGRCRVRAGCGRLIPLAAVLLLGTSPATLIAQSPRAVTVIGLDYAFQAPDTLPAGPATLSLLNRGTVRHELILYLLNEGRNPGEFLRSTLEERLSMGRPVGVIFADPGQPARAQLVVDLAQGRSYVFLCVIRDAPDKPPHVALGMAKALIVK